MLKLNEALTAALIEQTQFKTQVMRLVYTILLPLIKDQIGFNKKRTFADACTKALADDEAFFGLRFSNFNITSSLGDNAGLTFTGKPFQKPEISFHIPLPNSGQLVTEQDHVTVKAVFIGLSDQKDPDPKTLPNIAQALNDALAKLLPLTGKLDPAGFAELLTCEEQTQKTESDQQAA